MDPSKRPRTSQPIRRALFPGSFGTNIRKRRFFRPGFDRSGGFYGRFFQPGSRLMGNPRRLHIERKFFDTNISFLADATTEVPATGQLTLIPQGTTESTRVGRECTIKSIQINVLLTYIPGASTTGVNTVYIWLVLDKQANGAAAAATDVLTSTNATLAMVNIANSDRFVIMRKWVYTMQAAAGAAAAFSRDQKKLDEYLKCNVPIQYSSTTGAITEIKSNNFFFVAGCEQSADDVTSVEGTVRLRFTDL